MMKTADEEWLVGHGFTLASSNKWNRTFEKDFGPLSIKVRVPYSQSWMCYAELNAGEILKFETVFRDSAENVVNDVTSRFTSAVDFLSNLKNKIKE